MKQREVTNFQKAGKFIASFCKIGCFPRRSFLFEIKNFLYECLEH